MKAQTNKGFTLIELVIAMAIIGILASIAFPSYTEYMAKARRGDCSTELVLLANAIERFGTARGTYAGVALGPAATFPAQCPIDGGTPVYNFQIVAANASSFSIQAVPIGTQANDECGTLTLDSLNRQGVTGASGGVTAQDCW